MPPCATLLGCLVALATLGASAPGQETATGAKPGAEPELIAVPGTKTRLVKPEGFEIAREFPGFGRRELMASVMVTEIPGPYAEVTAGFGDEGKLATAGFTLLGKEEVQLGGRPGLLLHMTQRVGSTTVEKWIGAVGDEKETVLVVAAFPEKFADRLSGPLRDSVLSLRWDRGRVVDPFADLAFGIEPPESLRFAARMGNMLMYTEDGTSPKTDPRDPVFVVGRAVSDVIVADPAEFAAARVRQTATVRDIEVEANESIEVDGLRGREIVATATDAKGDEPMVVYQVLLFEGDSYYILQGLVGADGRERVLPDFRAMARGFRRKAAGEGQP